MLQNYEFLRGLHKIFRAEKTMRGFCGKPRNPVALLYVVCYTVYNVKNRFETLQIPIDKEKKHVLSHLRGADPR